MEYGGAVIASGIDFFSCLFLFWRLPHPRNSMCHFGYDYYSSPKKLRNKKRLIFHFTNLHIRNSNNNSFQFLIVLSTNTPVKAQNTF